MIRTAGTTPNVYLYCGERWDSDLGLYYLRARYLNPGTGRFMTMDTFEGAQTDPLSLHKYLYGADNPVNSIDPSGHETLETMMMACAIGAGLQTGYDLTVLHAGNTILDTLTRITADQTVDEIDRELMDAVDATLNDSESWLESLTKSSVLEVVSPGWLPTVGSGYAYSVAFEMRLLSSSYPGKSRG